MPLDLDDTIVALASPPGLRCRDCASERHGNGRGCDEAVHAARRLNPLAHDKDTPTVHGTTEFVVDRSSRTRRPDVLADSTQLHGPADGRVPSQRIGTARRSHA